MIEYNVTFRKVLVSGDPDVLARVSEEDEFLIDMVDTIRSRIVANAKDTGFDLGAIPNGHFMEIEFLVDGQSVQGVVFMTPNLPGRFVAILRRALESVGIDNVIWGA